MLQHIIGLGKASKLDKGNLIVNAHVGHNDMFFHGDFVLEKAANQILIEKATVEAHIETLEL